MNLQLYKTITLKNNCILTKTISMPTPNTMEEDLETKKRETGTSEATKAIITSHFSVKSKSPPSLLILKESRYSNLTQEAKDNGNKDKVYIGVVLSFLCLMIDVLSDRDYIE